MAEKVGKSASLGLRVSPAIKDALAKAAASDGRSVASLAERIIAEWLRTHGHLPK